MKIGVTGLRGIPGVMGGVETHCEELLPRLKRLDPALDIIVFARAPYVDPHVRSYAGIAIVPLPAPRHVGLEAIAATLIAVVAARRGGMRAVHIHAIGPALATPLARALGLKVILTHHGEDYARAKWGRFARLLLRLGERLGVDMADRTIAVSPSLANRLAARFPRSAGKIVYIPNGVSALPPPVPDTLDALGLAEGDYVIGVGRLVPEKGFHDLIEAHRLSGDPRRLVIAGGADHETSYSRGLMQADSRRVLFTGRIDRGKLHALLSGAGLFVMPSYHEGLPIAALEAASCAAPMLLSDIQPNRDLGLPEQHYFPTGDVAALARKLSQPAQRYAIDAQAIKARFDWDAVARETMLVYHALA